MRKEPVTHVAFDDSKDILVAGILQPRADIVANLGTPQEAARRNQNLTYSCISSQGHLVIRSQ